MRPFLLALLAGSLVPGGTSAQVYSWKDASGKVHYGDRPPTTQPGEARKLPPPPPINAEAERKAFLERQMAERVRHQKAQEQAAEQGKKRIEEAGRQENCQRAKAGLSAMESGQTRFVVGPDGERKALEGELLAAELVRARQLVTEWCAPPKPAGQ